MAHIDIVSPRRADPELRRAYDRAQRVFKGFRMPGVVRIFSRSPPALSAMVRRIELALSTGTAPRREREMVAALVSRFNGCHY